MILNNSIPPYSLSKTQKHELLTSRLADLTQHHYQKCGLYRRILDSLNFDISEISTYYDIPFLPVSLFKNHELKSVSDGEIYKTMTSSGTTGQAVSRIFLDKTTAVSQQKTLVKIMQEFIGTQRLPMIIIDCPSVVKDRRLFSARGAGILGFSIFGSDKVYALKDDMSLNIEAVGAFLEKHQGKKILLFGFTFMIWEHFYKVLAERGLRLDLSGGILIHGGGWKKLVSQAVTQEKFAECLNDVCKITRVHDYYGMVEQTGCIYMQCECGFLHASVYSDIIIRSHRDFLPSPIGVPGIIQVLSAIPESYPGHSLLTEDEGVLMGEDDCPCGRLGKYFKINGRLKNAEIRGCGDTYAAML